MKRILWMTLLGGALWWAGAAQAQAPAAAPAAAEAEAPKTMSLWDLIVVGGWAMWPLGACSFGLIMIAVVNMQRVNARKLIPPAALAQIKAAAGEGNLEAMLSAATGTRSLFTNALAAGLRHLNPEDPVGSKPKVESAIAETVSREEAQLSFWINILSLITAISPMLGLLGTVSGMIGAFQKIGQGGMGKPELLASNIGEALITTAAGLIIAIPAMFCYFLFRSQLNRIIQQAEEEFTNLLDTLTGGGEA